MQVPNRNSKRQSSGEPTWNTSSKTILPRKCIFCNKSDKYMKNTRNKEKLTNCVQLSADERIRTLAKNRNDTNIIATASDELIAKEVVYHFTCYWGYTRSATITKSSKSKDDESNGFSQVPKSLVEFYEKSDVIHLEQLQQHVTSASGKKNLWRKIESKTGDFKFINHGKTFSVSNITNNWRCYNC